MNPFASGIVSTSKTLGWASAGTFYLAITQLYNHALGLAHAGMPVYTAGDLSNQSSSDAANMKLALSIPQVLFNSQDAAAALQNAASASGGASGSSPSQSVPSPGSTTFERFSHKVLVDSFNPVLNWLLNYTAIDPTNPMADLIAEGNELLTAGEGVLVGAWAAQHPFTSAILGGLQAVTGNEAGAAASEGAAGAGFLAGGPFISLMISFALFLVGAGTVESVILPMIIYITWLFAILNVIAFAAEFVLAAPLAAFQHMRFDGQNFVEDHQRPFYTLIFNGVLRPSLLLFGLFISTFVLTAVLTVFNATFKMGIVAVQGQDFIGVTQTCGLVALQVYIQYQVLTRCVSLIHRVPHMVATLLRSEVSDLAGQMRVGSLRLPRLV
jgi:conjugal transfer/type IV secretion protein DotA/TraY